MNIESLNAEQLAELIAKATELREEKFKKEKMALEAKEAIEEILKNKNISILDVYTEFAPKIMAGARYRCPTTGLTWSGLGRPPFWITQYQKSDWDKFKIV